MNIVKYSKYKPSQHYLQPNPSIIINNYLNIPFFLSLKFIAVRTAQKVSVFRVILAHITPPAIKNLSTSKTYSDTMSVQPFKVQNLLKPIKLIRKLSFYTKP